MPNVFPGRKVDSVNDKVGAVKVVEDKNFVHIQSDPVAIWTITHPLDKKVSITITDTAGTVMEGRVVINDGDTVTVEFNYPFSGEAVLN